MSFRPRPSWRRSWIAWRTPCAGVPSVGRPSVSPEQRKSLAEQQAALVAAQAGQAAPPGGFDAEHVRTAAASLFAKRRRGVEKAWPGLAASLGDRFAAVFGDYA